MEMTLVHMEMILDRASGPLWTPWVTELSPEGASLSDGFPAPSRLVRHSAQTFPRGMLTVHVFLVQLAVGAAGG